MRYLIFVFCQSVWPRALCTEKQPQPVKASEDLAKNVHAQLAVLQPQMTAPNGNLHNDKFHRKELTSHIKATVFLHPLVAAAFVSYKMILAALRT